jgi:translocation and assembly module TamB
LSRSAIAICFSCKTILQASHLMDWSVATCVALPHMGRMDAPDHPEPPVRRLKKRHIFGAVLLLFLILLAVVWWQRFNLADRLVRDQLKEAGVRATYKIKDIGFRTQRLTDVVVGDPTNPDLTAKLVEVNLTIGFGTPAIRSVWAEGVYVKGSYADGVLRFGELDKFRDMTSKKPFEFPDLNIGIRRSSLSLSTPWGAIGVGAEGQGHLRRNFTGQVAVRSRRIEGEGCSADALRVDGSFAIRNRQPEFEGPLASARLSCPSLGLAIAGPELKGEFRLTERFDRWLGDTGFAANAIRFKAHQFSSPSGKISFDGGRERTNYTLKLDKTGYRTQGLSIAKLASDVAGDISFGDKGVAISARGGADASGGNADAAWLNGLSSLTKSTAGTPVGPVVAQLGPALKGVLRAFAASLNFDAAVDGEGRTNAVLTGMKLTSGSGAKLALQDNIEIRNGALKGPVRVSLSGGGLPSGSLALTPSGSGWSGTLALSPYAAKNSSLSLTKLAFTGSPRGDWRINGQAALSGPLLGGMLDVSKLDFNGRVGGDWLFKGQAAFSGPLIGGNVKGLSLPVDGSWSGGRLSLLKGCSDVRFQSFKTGSFSLPGQSIRACPQGGTMFQTGVGGTKLAFASPSLAGKAMLGSTPVRYAGSQVRFSLDKGFVASNVSVDLGNGDSLTQMKMDSLVGRFEKGGMAGTFANGVATIGSVPLLVENANGKWSYVRSVLGVDSSLTVSDAEQVDRFKTLNVPDLALTLENGSVTAIGHLHEPTTGTRVSDVDILHELSSGKGRALLALEGLTFDDRLQPEMLTPLTLGAIANVKGTVSGDGRIGWDRDGVRSSGTFGSRSLDFAAAFGPVTGLSTEVKFTDLLGMETAPSQLARLAVVNPGVPAFDGQIKYRLLADQKVEIEEGRWPFFGGELILEPTILDFDVQAQRRLTFRLVGLDAEKFLAGYELENMRVTGVFDGTLPMVFDQEGGRIVGGWLVSRKGGGEVSYLGQLSYEEMGVFANYAFEALRSIQFEEMQIGVDGNIGGEVVTEVRFRGLQQGTLAKRNFITKQLAKLPIQFNVRIQAEFLSLIGSMRALYDAEYAAQRYKSIIDAQPPFTGEEDTAAAK